MATEHQERALAALHRITSARVPVTGDYLLAQLDRAFPDWRKSAPDDKGYCGDPLTDTVIVLSRALHGALPEPFNLFPYDWRNMHGFSTIQVFLQGKQLTVEAIAAWLEAAAEDISLQTQG